MCIVLPASGDGAPKGILLGTSPGGGNYYVEPPSAVPLNNDLGAARGEAAAAEEAVMWKLTGQISDDLEDIQAALDTVSLQCLCILALAWAVLDIVFQQH